MWFLQALTVVGCAIVCYGQTEWTYSNYPNPMKDFSKCGLGRPSFLCDPNGILTVREADHLDHVLNGTYHLDLPCPCSAHKCRTYNKGYAIAIAIIKRLKLNPGDEPVDKAREFASKLADERWRFGQCDNDIVIFYSADEKMHYTVAGKTALYKLSESQMDSITKANEYMFNQGLIGPALYSIVTDYRDVLRGTYVPYEKRKNQEPRGSASHLTFAVSTLFTVISSYFLSRSL